jgi:hypothetical protein
VRAEKDLFSWLRLKEALAEKYACAEDLLPQKRKDAKKSFRQRGSALRLCIFAGKLA